MEKTEIDAEKIGILAMDNAKVKVKKLVVNIIFPKQDECLKGRGIFIIFSLVFSIAAWVLGICANLVVDDSVIKSMALRGPSILLWVLGLACMIYLHYLKKYQKYK